MKKTLRCHECGSDMVRDTRPHDVNYKDRSVTVDQSGWYCTGCSEVVIDGADMAVLEDAFVRLKAEVDDILTPTEVARIRKRLGLSQRRAGAILGGGPRSFQKYESGTDWVTRAMANLLRLLDRDPGRLTELVQVNEGRTGTVRTRTTPTASRPRATRRPVGTEG
jgi:HTH-type transcriptional regulator/antitoxin MqsA